MMFSPSYKPASYNFTARQVGNKAWKCRGCDVNVIKCGDFCMLHPQLWESLGLKYEDNMCIACIEAKLGRKLRPLLSGDFIGFPSVKGYPMSDILRNRIHGDTIALKSGELVARDSKRGKAELRKREPKTNSTGYRLRANRDK